MAATDVAIQNKILKSGTIAPVISNEEMEDIIRIVKSLEESGLLIKGVSETIKNEAKGHQGGYLAMLLCTLAASLLGNALIGKEVVRASQGVISRLRFLMPPHCLTNFKIQKYYQKELKFNGIYSKNNLSKIKDGTYIINLDEYE